MKKDEYEVWVCTLEPLDNCVTRPNDAMCFTFNEQHEVFVPWGYNSELRIIRDSGGAWTPI